VEQPLKRIAVIELASLVFVFFYRAAQVGISLETSSLFYILSNQLEIQWIKKCE